MKTPVAKKKADKRKVTDEQLRKAAQSVMDEFKAESEARYRKAKKHYNSQDDDTQEVLDRITTHLLRIARKHMWVGVGNDKIVMQIPEEIIYHNMFYMAVEILKDLALMDVRVANYTFPADVCVECGKEIKAKKKAKR